MKEGKGGSCVGVGVAQACINSTTRGVGGRNPAEGAGGKFSYCEIHKPYPPYWSASSWVLKGDRPQGWQSLRR